VQLWDGERLFEAVVYEICLELNERVAMICSWITADRDMHTMSYSPQFIVALNATRLPELRVEMTPEDLAKMKNHHTVSNVVSETNSLRRALGACTTIQWRENICGAKQ